MPFHILLSHSFGWIRQRIQGMKAIGHNPESLETWKPGNLSHFMGESCPGGCMNNKQTSITVKAFMALFRSYQDLGYLIHQEFPLKTICLLPISYLNPSWEITIYGKSIHFSRWSRDFSLYSLTLHFIMLSNQFPANHFQMLCEMRWTIKYKARKK